MEKIGSEQKRRINLYEDNDNKAKQIIIDLKEALSMRELEIEEAKSFLEAERHNNSNNKNKGPNQIS